jgi:exosortase/archaeosortase family protein
LTALALRAARAARAPVPVTLRLSVLAGCTIAAFWLSLSALAGQWSYETPLADLILVPVLALGVMLAALRRHPYVDALRLGRLDLLLGTVLLGAAVMLVAAGPVVWSKYFWAMRIDLLVLPLFVLAAVMLLFGARAIVPFAFPVLSLLLAWPLPYLAVLDRALSGFTSATTGAVAYVAPRLGLATQVAGSDGVFRIAHAGKPFSLGVGSACSGVNSLLGFFLLAVFALYFLEGLFLRRVAWLALGAACIWAANVGRILVLFAVGSRFGERAAITVLHPVAGLVALNLVVVLLVRAMPRFHLFWRELEPVHADSPLAQPAPPEKRASALRLTSRIAILAAATFALALADGRLAVAARGFSNDGVPKIAAFAPQPVAAPGWTIRRAETIGWAAPYYGNHSSWVRFVLRSARPSRAAFTVWVDAVRSPNLGALDAYSLAHCYSFHNFDVEASHRVDLGNGVTGQTFVYAVGGAEWHAVSWQWPVSRGGKVEHERLVLLAASSAHPAASAPRAHGVSGFVLWLLDLRRPSADPNPKLTRALESVGAGIVARRIEGAA